MCRTEKATPGPSIQLVTKFIFFLVLTCDGRTIGDCSDFVSVKMWKYRRQLLIHRSNGVWLREVAAWESTHSHGYVLREATDGDRWSYRGIYDEGMRLRSCQVTTDGRYTELRGNSRLISDVRHGCRRNETALPLGRTPSNLFGTILRTDSHSSRTFDDIVKFLDDEKVVYRLQRAGSITDEDYSYGGPVSQSYEDAVRSSDQPEEGDDGPSVEVYRRFDGDVPPDLDGFLDFEMTTEKCHELNKDAMQRHVEAESPPAFVSWLPKSLRGFPSTVRKQMEAIGLVDATEEDDDGDFEDDEHVIMEEGDHLERRKRGLFMFPGTLWCGTGNRAPTYDSLGMYNKTDMCCRDHDHSTPNMSINSGETKYNFRNWGMYTLTHCSLDKIFHKCLRKVRNTAAYEVGRGYFNVFNVQCFVIRNRKQCLEVYWYMPWRCKKHEYLPTACLRGAQPFPSQKYIWPS